MGVGARKDAGKSKSKSKSKSEDTDRIVRATQKSGNAS
jgi:hypothetical protein